MRLGFTSFSVSLSGKYSYHWFTATATDLSTGDTSEFSPSVQACPGVFQFTDFTYVVDERSSFARISVFRTCGSYGRETVDYFSSDFYPSSGWARPGSVCGFGADYAPASGTLVEQFARPADTLHPGQILGTVADGVSFWRGG